MRIFALLIVVLAAAEPDTALAQPHEDLEIVTGEIDGEEVQYVKDELLIKPYPDADISVIAGDLSATVVDSIPLIGWFRVKLESGADALPVWEDIQNMPGIQECRPRFLWPVPEEGVPEPGMDEIVPPETIQWPTTITLAHQAWNQLQPSDVLIAILDTGIDQVHYETGEFANSHDRILLGENQCYPGEPPWDDNTNGHGTHRVSEIAAPWDDHGVRGIISGNYGPNGQLCRVLVEKVAHSNGWFEDELASGLLRVVTAEGAEVVSISLWMRTGAPGMGPTWDALQFVNTNHPHTIVFCCSGNTGELPDDWHIVPYILYPAAWSCALDCVMAVGASTEQDVRNPLSEWRPGEIGAQLSLLAPGELGYWVATRNGFYTPELAGATSGATAHAAGIAAMLISKYPGFENHQIKMQLQNSACRIPEEEGCGWGDYSDCWGHQCWCDRPGSGRIDAVYCLRRRIWVRCPRGAQTLKPPCNGDIAMSGGVLNVGEICVYDLLGRRLVSLPLPNAPWDKASILSYVGTQGGLPRGAKIVRLRTEREVLSWRLAP